MKRCCWDYAIHGLLWAVLAFLALHVKAVAHAPIAVMFLLASLPYLLVTSLGGAERSAGMAWAYRIYQLVGLAILIGWPVAGIWRWRQSPSVLLTYPHLLVALAGWWCTLLVGSINFPFML